MTQIGNRVRVITNDSPPKAIEGVLYTLNTLGVTVYRTDGMPETQGSVFIPMHRVHEIVDLGRAP